MMTTANWIRDQMNKMYWQQADEMRVRIQSQERFRKLCEWATYFWWIQEIG